MPACKSCTIQTGTTLELCSTCMSHLPPITADLYRRGHATLKQTMDCLRMRMTSAKTLHGGRHGRERRS